MQAKIETLKAKTSSGEDYLVYPRTLIKCVTNENGDSLETTLKEFISDNVNEVLDEALSDTYAEKTYVAEQIANANHLTREIVTEIPTAETAKDNVIYMYKVDTATGNDVYQEYQLISGEVVLVGDTSVDLSGYVENTELTSVIDGTVPVAKASDADTLNGKSSSEFALLSMFNGQTVVDNADEAPLGACAIHENTVNTPYPFWATLLTFNKPHDYLQQIAIPWSEGHITTYGIKVRIKDAGTWGEWHNVGDGSNADTVDGFNASDLVKQHATLLSLAQVNDANWRDNYEGVVDSEVANSIGLDGSNSCWWHIKYFKNTNADGYGSQLALPLLPSNNNQTPKYRTSDGLTFRTWTNFNDGGNADTVDGYHVHQLMRHLGTITADDMNALVDIAPYTAHINPETAVAIGLENDYYRIISIPDGNVHPTDAQYRTQIAFPACVQLPNAAPKYRDANAGVWGAWKNFNGGGNADMVDGYHAHQLQLVGSDDVPMGAFLVARHNIDGDNRFKLITNLGNEISVANADTVGGLHASDFQNVNDSRRLLQPSEYPTVATDIRTFIHTKPSGHYTWDKNWSDKVVVPLNSVYIQIDWERITLPDNSMIYGTLTLRSMTDNSEFATCSIFNNNQYTEWQSFLPLDGSVPMSGTLRARISGTVPLQLESIDNSAVAIEFNGGDVNLGSLGFANDKATVWNAQGQYDILHTGNIGTYRDMIHLDRRTVNLSDTSVYDPNTWYPVIGDSLPTTGMRRIKVDVQLDSGSVPAWSGHERGFTCHLDLLVKGCGWGVTDAQSMCLEYNWKFVSDNLAPLGYGQLTNSSSPVLWLRGGGIYFVSADYECNWTPHTAAVTVMEQTIAPVNTAPTIDFAKTTIYANLSGNSASSDYSTRAGSVARTSDGAGMSFHWNGQPGQPQWIWGGNDADQLNMYVWNPANFNVSHANTSHELRTYDTSGNSHGNSWLVHNRYNFRNDGRFWFYVEDGSTHQIAVDYATNSTNATNASNADTLDGRDSSGFVQYLGLPDISVLNNANYTGSPYEAVIADGTSIGLTGYWWHIKYYKHVNNDGYGFQEAKPLNANGTQVPMFRYSTGTTWSPWTTGFLPLSGGTLTGDVVAAASTDYANTKVRNTVFVTADPGAGASTSYANGSIICVYE